MKTGYSRFVIVLLGAFALLLVSAHSAFADSASNYAGKFKGDKLSAEFVAAGDGTFTGTVSMGSSQFPLKAHIENGQLQGTFTSGGTDYPFTAQFNGGNLSLTSGATTYTLQGAAANPLDDVAAPAAPPVSAVPTRAVAPDAPAEVTNPAPGEDLYKQGEDAEKKPDYAAAADFYRKSAALGYAPAMNNLGFLYQKGLGVEVDNAAAMTWYLKAAHNGNGPGMGNVGWMYLKGLGVPADPAQAVKWYESSSEAGDASSMTQMGMFYLNGIGVAKDAGKAAEWFGKAANAGDGYAMNQMGLFYLNGSGVEKDAGKAAEWFRKSADAGDVDGLFDTAYCYETGTGVTKDHDAAVNWYKKAADAGSDDAKKWLADDAAPHAAAGKGGDVTGKWAATGDNTFTITFDKDGTINVETNGSSVGGQSYKVTDNAINIDGSNSINGLTIGGTWKLTWINGDSFKVTDDGGKNYTLTRQK